MDCNKNHKILYNSIKFYLNNLLLNKLIIEIHFG